MSEHVLSNYVRDHLAEFIEEVRRTCQDCGKRRRIYTRKDKHIRDGYEKPVCEECRVAAEKANRELGEEFHANSRKLAFENVMRNGPKLVMISDEEIVPLSKVVEPTLKWHSRSRLTVIFLHKEGHTLGAPKEYAIDAYATDAAGWDSVMWKDHGPELLKPTEWYLLFRGVTSEEDQDA